MSLGHLSWRYASVLAGVMWLSACSGGGDGNGGEDGGGNPAPGVDAGSKPDAGGENPGGNDGGGDPGTDGGSPDAGVEPGPDAGSNGGSDAGSENPDTVAPTAPVLLRFTPTGPANENAPVLSGRAEALATVRVYASADCTGMPVAQASANASGDFSVTLSVADDGTHSFQATATDAANNTSACSPVLSYVEDSSAPAAPVLARTEPASPANENAPRLVGTAEPGSTVRVYASASCSGAPVAQATADAHGAFSVGVSVADNTTTSLHATATDAASNASSCGQGLTYVENSNAPAAPTFTGSQPGSPANHNTPVLTGTTEGLATVRVYATPDCSGTALATVTADAAGLFSARVTVGDDSDTTFRATATNALGTSSACGASSLRYVEDSTPPASISLTGTSPGSPSRTTAPVVSGATEPRVQVRLYTSGACEGMPAATTTADDSGAFSTQVTVAANATTLLRASAVDAAGNASACSASLPYVEDSTAPAAPTLSGLEPASPSFENSIALSGTTVADATVRIYTTDGCSGQPVAEVRPDDQGAFRLFLDVNDDTTTTFRATATDAAGNVSACGEGLTYVEDSTAPAAPALSSVSPASPANHNSPVLTGTTEPGATVRIHVTAPCRGAVLGSAKADGSGAFSVTLSVADNSNNSFYATATDIAGNPSNCSSRVQYIEDSAAPNRPFFSGTDPASPANHNRPRIIGTAEQGATVRLYTSGGCSGTPVAQVVPGQANAFSVFVDVADNTTTVFHADVRDSAGNVSICVEGPTYVEDSITPAPPSLTGTAPASPSNSNSPVLSGTAEPGATVRIYREGACPTTALATVTTTDAGTFSATLSVTSDTTSRFTATATDKAGNRSACASTLLTYIEDSTAPASTSVTVFDGPTGELDWQADVTRMEARWLGFTDANGIAHYERNVSTSSACAGDVLASIQLVGGTASHAFSGQMLAERTYFNCVRAFDAAGNTSSWIASDGITVDSTPPTVVAVSPEAGATGVDTFGPVTVTFSEPVDASTVNLDTFRVTSNSTTVDGIPEGCEGTVCTFRVRKPIAHNAPVSVTLTTGIKDRTGNALGAPVSWSFTTRPLGWLAPVSHAQAASSLSATGIDDLGQVHVVWREGPASSSRIMANRFVSGTVTPGTGWRGVQPVSTSGAITGLSMAASEQSGTVVAVWVVRVSETLYELRGAVYLPGFGWRPEKTLASSPDRIVQPVVAVGAGGISGTASYVLWQEERDADFRAYLCALTGDGTGNWGTKEVLEADDIGNITHDVAVSSNGLGMAVWSALDTRFSPAILRLHYATRNGSSGFWSGFTVTPNASGVPMNPRLAFSANGTGTLVWQAVDNSSRIPFGAYASTWTSASGFSAPVALNSFTLGKEIFEPRVGMDAQGNAFAAWLEGSTDNPRRALVASRRDAASATWTRTTLQAQDVTTLDLSVGLNGVAHVVHGRSQNPGGVFGHRYVPSTGWGATQTLLAGSSSTISSVDVSVNENGDAAATWTQVAFELEPSSWTSLFY